MELAFGYCSWSPSQFWDATWAELSAAVRGTRQFGVVALIGRMFGTGNKPGSQWTEAEAIHLVNQLDERREELDKPSNIIDLRRALKKTRPHA